MVIVISIFTLVAVAFITASSLAANTPLYTVRMEQMSSKMSFLPTTVNKFIYSAENGCVLNYSADGYYDVRPLGTKDTCIGDTCDEPTCGETCPNTWCHTCPSTCQPTCSTCPPTCPPTCQTFLCTCSTCQGQSTCEYSCEPTCEPTCPDTCYGPTCPDPTCEPPC